MECTFLGKKGVFFLIAVGILCLNSLSAPVFAEVTSSDVVARRAELERELGALEIEIQTQSRLLGSKRQERVSIERDVAILNAEIKKAQLSIRARELEIERLNTQIGTKEEKIEKLSEGNYLVFLREPAKDNKANIALLKLLSKEFKVN